MDVTSEAEACENDLREEGETRNKIKVNKTQSPPLPQLSTGSKTQDNETNHLTPSTKEEQISGLVVNEDESSKLNCDNSKSTTTTTTTTTNNSNSRINDNRKGGAELCPKDEKTESDHKGEEDCPEKGGRGEGEGEEGCEGAVNPLSVDLYDKLCGENVQEKKVLWDSYMVGEELQKTCRRLFLSERQLYVVMMSIFVVLTFAMVFGLCVLQAQMSMTSKQLLAKVQGPKKPIPQGMYTLYYDYLESGVLPENVDMRANTSIFVH